VTLPSLFDVPPHAVFHQDENIDIAVRPRFASRNRAKQRGTEHLWPTCQFIDQVPDLRIHGSTIWRSLPPGPGVPRTHLSGPHGHAPATTTPRARLALPGFAGQALSGITRSACGIGPAWPTRGGAQAVSRQGRRALAVNRRGHLLAQPGHITQIAATDWLQPNPRPPQRADSAALLGEILEDPHTREQLESILAAARKPRHPPRPPSDV
jgi:hypothetical protein